MGVGAVLDHCDVMLAGDGGDAVEVGHRAEKMHRNHGPGARRDRRFEGRRVEAESVRFAVDEDRCGSDIARRDAGGQPGPARYDHFVPRPHAERLKRAFQRGGAVDHQNAIGGMVVSGEGGGEFLFATAVKRPLAAQVQLPQQIAGLGIGRGPWRQDGRLGEYRLAAGDGQFFHDRQSPNWIEGLLLL
ncbi:hypothetical protein SDC9_102533 [bioreactor metagenome]|uniref:Uncharacterized protein n=1 Tax=bioreactor metagenome TaxID=1076179 RepID=A0A645AS60_9ZZZZ